MVIGNVEIKNTIETITAEIRESITLLEMAYGECEDEKTSAVISCVMRSTNSSLRKADSLVNTLLAAKEYTPSKIETTTQNSFAARLRLALAHSGMTQTTVAGLIGVSQGTVSAMVTGKSKETGIARCGKIAQILGINADWLRYGEGEMTSFNFSR
ncbi:helix-turn-helix domain-containing protein [Providencia sp. Me31A]|uniref:helix-turn-helix domain-containing protein n=1 Tax=Providencia sp. Me31A TaxID=3392637 RepID=UPI003D28381F